METVDILPLLDQLDDDVDDVEEVLNSVLSKSLAETSQKLPVLDRAKFHIGIVYALETLIFSYLKLRGIDAIQHPVYKEITRLKHYFAKIENAEKPPEQRTMTLDKAAAGRFIKHGLAGNDKIDTERKEQNAKEKARAQLKASILAKKTEQSEQSSKQPLNTDANASSVSDSESSDDEEMIGEESTPATKPSKTTHPEQVPKKSTKQKHDMKSKKLKHLQKDVKKARRKEKRERKEKHQETRKARKETRHSEAS